MVTALVIKNTNKQNQHINKKTNKNIKRKIKTTQNLKKKKKVMKKNIEKIKIMEILHHLLIALDQKITNQLTATLLQTMHKTLTITQQTTR